MTTATAKTERANRRHEWAPRIWEGFDFFAWLRLLARNRFAVHPAYWYIAIIVTFVSAGYYPTKVLVDADGNSFKPGPFVRAYLTLDLAGPQYYLFADAQLTASQSLSPELLKADLGLAARPWARVRRLEFRLGSGLDAFIYLKSA